MKKTNLLCAVALLAALSLAGCSTAGTDGTDSGGDTGGSPDETLGQESAQPAVLTSEPKEYGHDHESPAEGNVLEHEVGGYCGNTVTTVSYRVLGEDSWSASFWGNDSVELTDLLLYLDYTGDMCRCPTEYTVDTEFGENYGINLTKGFVRYEDCQVVLTAEQAELIKEILDRARDDAQQ